MCTPALRLCKVAAKNSSKTIEYEKLFSRRTIFGYSDNAKRIFDQQVQNIREHEDDMSKFKLAHAIVKEVLSDKKICIDSSIVSERNKKVFDYNIIGGRCNRLRIFFNTYRNVAPSLKLSNEHILQASIMGYLNEMLLSSFMVIDDILDESEKRRNKTSWYKKVGRVACNTPLMICSGVYIIMKHFFESEPYYIPCTKVFNDVFWIGVCAVELDYLSLDILGNNKKNCNWQIYNQLCNSEFATTAFYLPIVTALHMAECDFQHTSISEELLKIFFSLGYYLMVENDYNDRYSDSNTGKLLDEDIKLGKLSWLLLTALEHCDHQQREVIQDCYGKDDPKCMKAIVDIYEELKIQDKCIKHKKEIFHSISNNIKLVPEIRVQKILFDTLYVVENWYKDV